MICTILRRVTSVQRWIYALKVSCLLVETELDGHDQPFSGSALEKLPWGRLTFEKLPMYSICGRSGVVSIDPIGCQDIDDALSIHRDLTNNGEYEEGVHNADVSSGGSLDREASARATSVYLEDRRLDMLPAILCEDFSSFRPGLDRYAASALFRRN